VAKKPRAVTSRPKKGWLGSGKRPPADPNWASRQSKRKKARRKRAAKTAKGRALAEAYAAAGGSVAGAGRILEAQGLSPSTLQSNPDLRAAAERRLEEALEAAGVDAVRTLTEVRRIAYADPRRLFSADGGLLPAGELDDDAAATLASVETKRTSFVRRDGTEVEETTSKVRQWDKPGALRDLMKAQRLLPEVHEHSGPRGGPIPLDPTGGAETRREVMESILQMVRPKRDPRS
jgi:phage terminase small subunit